MAVDGHTCADASVRRKAKALYGSESMKNGFFELSGPFDLFRKCQSDFVDFENEPSHYALFNLVTSLSHLRDWIWPYGHKGYTMASDAEHAEVELHRLLHNDPNYNLVRELCNSAKHYRSNMDAKVVRGSNVALTRVGDSLNHTYFVVGGRDVRDYLYPVMRQYHLYFERKGYIL